MGEFPSGQRGQTVNLLRFASMVRIRPPPPQKTAIRKDGGFLWWMNGWMDSNMKMQGSGGALLDPGWTGSTP